MKDIMFMFTILIFYIFLFIILVRILLKCYNKESIILLDIDTKNLTKIRVYNDYEL